MNLKYNNKSKYLDDFNKQKIIYPETTQSANFVLDTKSVYIDKTCFMLISEYPEYLLATLSSSLFEYAYKNIFSSIALGAKAYQYNKHALLQLPVIDTKKINQHILLEIKNLSSLIINTSDDKLKLDLFKKLDNIFYKIYGISDDEISIITKKLNT